MPSPSDLNVDSKEGIAFLISWARGHGFALDRFHKQLAEKYGVSTEGVNFRLDIPSK